MQFIPDNLKTILHERLKSGNVSRPQIRVEVDRMTFVPGYVEELTLYDAVFQKTIEIREIKDGEETVVTDAPMTFPLLGKKYGDINTLYKFTSKYGWRVLGGKKDFHNGTDIASVGGASNVVAVYSGTVSKISYQAGGAGYYVNIDHGGGLVTKYFHMVKDSIKVTQGQQVSAGQVIGTEGSSGGVTGRHLHFEVWVNGKDEDPLPWLKGDKRKKISQTTQSNITTPGEPTVTEVKVGYPGEVVFDEQLDKYRWMDNPMYKSTGGADSVDTKSIGNGKVRTYFGFNGSSTNHSFYINFNMQEDGYFDLNFSSNFLNTDGDSVGIYVNDKKAIHYVTFKGLDKEISLNDIFVPKGTASIQILMHYGGKMLDTGTMNVRKQFAIHSLKVQELDQTKTETQLVDGAPVLVNSAPQTLENFLYDDIPVQIQLETGKFVYQDTLVLPNVQKCEVDRNTDSECATATVSLTNPDGYFNPDYNPFYFPDLMAKRGQSPYSYFIPGNFHVGVLSENTPIRIYMGYGDIQERPMRVFTGLIDSCDTSGGDASLTIKARDMYKKVLNQVLLERVTYGKDPVYEESQQIVDTVSKSPLSRRQQIFAAAKKGQKEYGLPDNAYYFLLAICLHETNFGTVGQGVEPKNLILGYGAYDSQADYSLGGIEKQMHYGARRYYEALESKNYKVSSKDDVTYFWKGGDKGNYQWASDTLWPNAVWNCYKKIMADKKSYAPPNVVKDTTTTSTDDSPKLISNGEYWLKTAIIQDLVDKAGMFGWRVAKDDMQYPDAIIEESYYIEMNPETKKVVKALPLEEVTEEQKFETVDIKDLQVKAPEGWYNPLVEPVTSFVELKWKIGDAIQELLKDTTYRSYCDRYGTYRFEKFKLDSPVVATYRYNENIITLNKTIDYSRARSHLVIYDDGLKDLDNKNHQFASFIDKELLLELKGEVRTAVAVVPWAKTNSEKREVARRMFFDMKRLSRTIQASIPGNPTLDLMDRIQIIDKNTATVASFYIKGIRDSFDSDQGYIQMIDMIWSAQDQIIQIPGLAMNTTPTTEPIQVEQPNDECVLWDGVIYKYGMLNNPSVKKIQQKLISQGYSIPEGVTGNYLDQTKAAVAKFEKDKGLQSDGIMGQITWNKLFCPSWKPPSNSTTNNKITVASGIKTRSWRDNWKWRTDNDYIYQGEWENWGHHYGFIWLPSDLPAKLQGKQISSVKLYLHRTAEGGISTAQKPTFWLHKMSGATGNPSVINGTNWASNVGWASNEGKWVTLPVSFGESIRDGNATGIATYVSGSSPYVYFHGGSSVKIEIETY